MRRLAGGWLGVGLVLVLGLAIGMALGRGDVFRQPDAVHYVAMAAGQKAMLPFAWRPLGPLLVRALALAGVPERAGFYAEGTAALGCFLGAVLWLAMRADVERWMLVAVAGMAFWALEFRELASADVLFGALLAGFLVLLAKRRYRAAGWMLFPLAMTREATLLVLVCLLVAGWRRLGRREVGGAVMASLLGLGLVRWLARGALPDREGISGGAYLLAKMPWNFSKNVLGVLPWANVYPACEEPRWQMAVHVGRLQAVGVCGWVPWHPRNTLAWALVSFGLLPLLWMRLRRVPLGDGLWGDAVLMRFAALYGVASFLLAPLEGERVLRLYGYGWPAFLVAIPMLLAKSEGRFRTRWAEWAFVGVHLAVCWSIWWTEPEGVLLIAVVGYGVGAWLLWRSFSFDVWEDLPDLTHPEI